MKQLAIKGLLSNLRHRFSISTQQLELFSSQEAAAGELPLN